METGITGCMGRMGQMLVHEIISGAWDGISLSGGTILPEMSYHNTDFFVTPRPEELFERSELIIDFTVPEATETHIKLAAKHNIPLIIGTTGLSDEQELKLQNATKETSIIYAANMSVGVNMLLALVEQAAARLDGNEWDIEISETHHKHKIDAPSGTALALGKAAATGRGINLEDHASYDRSGARKDGDIGFAVQRGGDIVGEHIVSFFGEGERIELTHKATDRSIFAKGALRAAMWLKDQPNGLYNMRDVLGLT